MPFISEERPSHSGSHTLRFQRIWVGNKDDDMASAFDSIEQDPKSSTWVRRGWTFQEAALSTRMVFFGAMAVHLLCPDSRASESHRWLPNSLPPVQLRGSSLEFGYGLFQILPSIQAKPSPSDLRAAWMAMTTLYSQRLFTRASDVLPALEGMAASFKSSMGDECVAGL